MILRMQRLGEEPAKVAGCDEPVVGVVEQQVLVVLLQPDIIKNPDLRMMMMTMMMIVIMIVVRRVMRNIWRIKKKIFFLC